MHKAKKSQRNWQKNYAIMYIQDYIFYLNCKFHLVMWQHKRLKCHLLPFIKYIEPFDPVHLSVCRLQMKDLTKFEMHSTNINNIMAK